MLLTLANAAAELVGTADALVMRVQVRVRERVFLPGYVPVMGSEPCNESSVVVLDNFINTTCWLQCMYVLEYSGN